jgi:hypothetical protein
MDAKQVWANISTDVIMLAWSEWHAPNGFRRQFMTDPVSALEQRFGIAVRGELPPFELPEPPHLGDSAVQASQHAEAAYPFTCC